MKKVYLMILDGFGKGKKYQGNAIEKAKMPNFKQLCHDYPNTLLKASGNEVGLPDGVMGNSEVGHITLGAGRITFQTLEEINQSIKSGKFYKHKALLAAMEKARKHPLHLIGMISDEGVHSHINHLFALLELAKQKKVKKIFIHAITDGRDVEEKSASKYIKKIQHKIKELKINQQGQQTEIVSIIGRYYAMDRDNNWNRTKKAYELITAAKGHHEKTPLTAIQNAYKKGIETDYYIEPIILNKEGAIKKNDPVIFFNFRTDRPRQLTYALTGEQKVGFKTNPSIKPFIVCFGDYSKKAKVVFHPPVIKNNLSQIISKNSLKQLHIAETEKYAHVTFFFNSQNEKPYKNEQRVLIPSPKVPSYDQKPEMSAREITKAAVKEINKDYDLIVQNFANTDLVGHSGNLKATIKACEVIDECIGIITKAALKKGYDILITGDHGNAEYMIYEKTGDNCPSHTTNPVPLILVSKKYKNVKLPLGYGLKDVAPTILKILDIKKNKDMTGISLIS
jgi:2,3-bisphosphoglycerate-independent phosphoglycerate mutase